MEKQYIFYNTGKALAIFAFGMLVLFITAIVLVVLGASKLTSSILLVLIASIVTWAAFKWDTK